MTRQNHRRLILAGTLLAVLSGIAAFSMWRNRQVAFHRAKFAEIERYVMVEMWDIAPDSPNRIDNPMQVFDFHLGQLVRLGAVHKIAYQIPSIDFDDPKRGKLWEDIASEKIPACLNFKPRNATGTHELLLTVWCEPEAETIWDSYIAGIDENAWRAP